MSTVLLIPVLQCCWRKDIVEQVSTGRGGALTRMIYGLEVRDVK